MDHVTGKTVEVFVPSTGSSCTLPSLADGRRDHTLNGGAVNETKRTFAVTREDL